MEVTHIQTMIQDAVETLERHGAFFENVRFKISENSVSIHVRDRSRNFRIYLPDLLLLDRSRLSFSDDDVSFEEEGLPDDLISMWKKLLDFIFSDERIKALRKVFSEFETLPLSVKKLIPGLGLGHLVEDENYLQPSVLKKYLMGARCIEKHGRLNLMPLLDFANHAHDAKIFEHDLNSISISGKANDEIVVNYTFGDAFHFLATYFFPASVNHAYSTALRLTFNGRPLRIERSYLHCERHQAGALSPKIDINDKGEIVISHLLVGQRESPNTVTPAFKLAWEKAGLPHAEELFKAIYRTNVSLFVDLLRDLDGVEGMAADWLRQATYQQLKLMAEH